MEIFIYVFLFIFLTIVIPMMGIFNFLNGLLIVFFVFASARIFGSMSEKK
ncbi:hypothetical protein QMI71_004416 [Salmonella enterica]|nr:hypothetical protein [Salmonella enterica]